jgi:hypothetical protein
MGSDLKESRPNGQEFDVNGPMEVEVGEVDGEEPHDLF